jgi:hypothetical protein
MTTKTLERDELIKEIKKIWDVDAFIKSFARELPKTSREMTLATYETVDFILHREQSIRAEYDRSEKYWHDLCLVNQEKFLRLLATISEARKVLK